MVLLHTVMLVLVVVHLMYQELIHMVSITSRILTELKMLLILSQVQIKLMVYTMSPIHLTIFLVQLKLVVVMSMVFMLQPEQLTYMVEQ